MHNQIVIHQNAYTPLRNLMPQALPRDLRAIDVAAEAVTRFAALEDPFTTAEADAVRRPLEIFTRRADRVWADAATQDVLNAYSLLGAITPPDVCQRRLHCARAAAWAVASGQIYAHAGPKIPEHLWEIICTTRAPYVFVSHDGVGHGAFEAAVQGLRHHADTSHQRLVGIALGGVPDLARTRAAGLHIFRFTTDPDADRVAIHELLAHTRRTAWIPPAGWPGNE